MLNAQAPRARPQPGDDNIVYRLVHRLIPEGSDRPVPAPDISLPGSDLAGFPDTPYTLPKGRSYAETIPCSYAFDGPDTPSVWSWPFLIRTGLTDRCELRIYSEGPSVIGPRRAPRATMGSRPSCST